MPLNRRESAASKVSVAKSKSSSHGKTKSKSSKLRSNVSTGSAMQQEKDEMAAATQQAIKDNRENAVNVRKNRAYQQIKRDMEHRMRQRAKQALEGGEGKIETFYVDRDRAAVVNIGTKDIKNDLKGKKLRDARRVEAGNAIGDDEEAEKDTFLIQGKFELKYAYVRISPDQ